MTDSNDLSLACETYSFSCVVIHEFWADIGFDRSIFIFTS